MISRRAVLDLYNREILRHKYFGLSVRVDGGASALHQRVQLPHEYTVEMLPVPAWAAGKTLHEIQLRTRYNLTVVAIRRGGFSGYEELPDPDRTLAQQDYLAVVGRPVDMKRFATGSEQHPSPRGA